MTSEGDSPAEPPRPAKASTPAEFTTALRALRTWSGLTYRQLEGKAAAYRETLPASTIATTLGRATLPRERFVDAFTRACGLGDDDVREWLETRRRTAMADPAAEPAPSDEPPAPRPWWRRLAPLAVAAVVGVAVGIGATLGIGALSEPDPAPRDDLPALPVTGLSMRVVGSWAQIHPVGKPSLCITEGVDRTKRYEWAVAAQMPCSTVQPRVYLEPIGRGRRADPVAQPGAGHRLPHGPARGTGPEPGRAPRQLLGRGAGTAVPPRTARQPLPHRPATSDGCLGLRAPVDEEGAELVQEDCSDSDTQKFTIVLVDPPA